MSWFRSTPESEAVLAEERLVLSATEAVEEAMAIAGKNKQQLAQLLDVRPTEISQRLSGRRNLTLRTLARMLHVLGMRAELTLKPALPSAREETTGVRAAPLHVRREANVVYVPFEAKQTELDPRLIGRTPGDDDDQSARLVRRLLSSTAAAR